MLTVSLGHCQLQLFGNLRRKSWIYPTSISPKASYCYYALPSYAVRETSQHQLMLVTDPHTSFRTRGKRPQGRSGFSMFWSRVTSREDAAYSDDSDTSEYLTRHRSSRSKRDSKPSRSASWASFFGGTFSKGYVAPSTKKNRRSKKEKGSRMRGKPSRRWGLYALAVIAFIYIFGVYNDVRKKQKSRVNLGHGVVSNRFSPNSATKHQDTSSSSATSKTVNNADIPATKATSYHASGKVTNVDHSTGAYSTSSSSSHQGLRSNRLIAGPNIGKLSLDDVKSYYRVLAKHYLKSFTGGIYRQLFFDVLRRRTYALTPPGANKGVQCILFQIINKRVYMMDPYEVPRNSKPFYRTRINEVIWILSKLAEAGRIKDTEFLMAIHDCVQTVNKPHTYRGAHYQESNPTFTIVSCNFSNNIPFPMWEGADRDGGFRGWDEYVQAYAADSAPWPSKKAAAVFRGSNRPSMYFRNKEDADRHCDSVGRTRLVHLQRQHPGFFDVSIGGRCGGFHHNLLRLSPREHHRYKYIMYMEGNCGWADRLRHQIFGPSAIIKQETPCKQFFEPMMGPMIHYIPTDFFLTDTVQKIKWARSNDEQVSRIVKNANEFAGNFLTRVGIEAYVEVLLDEYTKLLVEPEIKLEHGAVEVTNRKV